MLHLQLKGLNKEYMFVTQDENKWYRIYTALIQLQTKVTDFLKFGSSNHLLKTLCNHGDNHMSPLFLHYLQQVYILI